MPIENLEFIFRVEVTLPDGNVVVPILKREDITLPALGSVARELAQYVPANAPPGIYEYTGYAGCYAPRVVSGEGWFEFEKTE